MNKLILISISIFLSFIVRSQVAIPSDYGIITNNRSIDNSSALTQMFTDASNGLITSFEFSGEINLDNTVYPPSGINGFTFRSSTPGTRATLYSDNLENLIVFSFVNVDNINWIDIKFESTHADAGSFGQAKNESSLLFYRFSQGDNWVHNNVEFTCPNVRTNGAKIYVQSSQMGGTDQTFITNIDFIDCYWHDIGRFAIEIFGQWIFDYNNPSPKNVTNFLIRDIEFSGCTVDNVIAGLGFSLVNGLENIRVHNNNFNNSGSALELCGQNTVFHDNVVTGDDSGFQLGSTYTGSPGSNINVWWATNDVHIYNNTFDLNDNMMINGARNVLIENNNFIKATRLYITEGDSVLFKNNDINFHGLYGNAIFQQDPDPFGLLEFENNIISLVNNINFFSGSADVFVSCSDIYAINNSNYPIGVDGQTDVDLYVGGVYNQTFNSTSNPCGTKGYGGSTPPNPCANDIANEYTTINLSSAASVSGLDNIIGTQSNVNGSPCAIELHNNDSNEPWARIEKSINLASNGLVAGDLIEVRIDGNNNTGVARIEIAQNNTSNTAVSLHDFTGTGWQTYVDTFAMPTGITTLDLWLYSNFNNNNPGVTYYDNLHLRKIDTTNCPDFLENEDFVIALPQGNLTAGGDSVVGTSLITNASTCAIEVHNGDNNEPWARYQIPLVLSNHGINTGDMIEFSLDGNNYNGVARVEVVEDNTPNTAITSHDYTATGWETYSDTLIVPSGITSLDIWVYSNYNNNTPGVALYDNLVVKKLNTTNTKEITSRNIKVYPNPATDKVNIEGLAQGENYKLYSSEGRLILHDNKPQIDVSNLSKGVYILKLKDKQIKIIKK